MDSIKAFAMGEANRDKESMVFDWNKAAELIRDNKPKQAGAGLKNDWEWTGGEIWSNGKPNMDDYTYLVSTWAIPEIELDGVKQPCYKMQSEVPEWTHATKWPKSAREILGIAE